MNVSVDVAYETLTLLLLSLYDSVYVGCGKRNFRRRRQHFPYTFFYHVVGALCG